MESSLQTSITPEQRNLVEYFIIKINPLVMSLYCVYLVGIACFLCLYEEMVLYSLKKASMERN